MQTCKTSDSVHVMHDFQQYPGANMLCKFIQHRTIFHTMSTSTLFRMMSMLPREYNSWWMLQRKATIPPYLRTAKQALVKREFLGPSELPYTLQLDLQPS